MAVSHGFKGVSSTIDEAAEVARALKGREGDARVQLSDSRPVNRVISIRNKMPLEDVPIADKLAFFQGISAAVKRHDDRISTARASYREITGKRYLVTSEGTSIVTDVSLMYLQCTATGAEGGVMASSRDEVAMVSSGWELFDKKEPMGKISDRLVHKVRNQLDGVACKRGSFPCVLGPRVAGMLAHEALGHLAEADSFDSAAFAGLENKPVAPEFVTMVDSPRVRDGFGNITHDDEGVAARKVILIDRGTLAGQMTNREWAFKLGCRPTGNARAETYKVPPIVRMRNTYFERGDMSLDELLGGIKDGYYCGDVRGGQAEANSSFQVAVQGCYEIKNGELCRPVRGLAISGVAVKSLKLIDALGKDFGMESSYCGKSDQYMPTSDGGPHVRVKKGGIVFGGDE